MRCDTASPQVPGASALPGSLRPGNAASYACTRARTSIPASLAATTRLLSKAVSRPSDMRTTSIGSPCHPCARILSAYVDVFGPYAGPDTIVWHLVHHHGLTVSRATVARHL